MAPKHLADLLKQTLAVKRIQTFLQTEDVEHLNVSEERATIAKSTDKELIVKGDVTWHCQEPRSVSDTENESSVFTLRNLDVAFRRGELTLIAGKAGSGKTLLLLALLGEVKLLRGHITYAVSPVIAPEQVDDDLDWSTLDDSVAYVPQVAWLQSLNIR